jgi:hypothetical protein
MFGKPLNWDYEFKIVKELKDLILEFLLNEEIPKSIIDKINIHGSAQEAFLLMKEVNPKGASPKWKWMAAYDFTRFRDSLRNPDARQFINEIMKSCFTDTYNGEIIESKYSFLTLLQIASRWAELKYRVEKNDYIN